MPLYFAAERQVVERDGVLIMVDDERMPLREGEAPTCKKVRFRTLGCYPLTGAVESNAETLEEIVQEMLLTTTSERQGRVDRRRQFLDGREEKGRVFLMAASNYEVPEESLIRSDISEYLKRHEEKDLLRLSDLWLGRRWQVDPDRPLVVRRPHDL